jgi:hypothetical protein
MEKIITKKIEMALTLPCPLLAIHVNGDLLTQVASCNGVTHPSDVLDLILQKLELHA